MAVRQIQVAGANLYQVAAEYLGNPLEWGRIAQASGLPADPMVTGLATLTIPERIPDLASSNPDLAGGVYNYPQTDS